MLCVPTSQGSGPLPCLGLFPPTFQPPVSSLLVYLLFVLYRPLNSTPTPVYVCKPRSTDHQTLPMQGSLTLWLVPSSLPSCFCPPCLSFRLAKPASCWFLGSSVLSSITPEPYSRSCQKTHRRVKPPSSYTAQIDMRSLFAQWDQSHVRSHQFVIE